MNWLARLRLTAGLRRLGHRPEWFRYMSGGRYASCWDCARWWDAVSLDRVAQTLRHAGECRGRRS